MTEEVTRGAIIAKIAHGRQTYGRGSEPMGLYFHEHVKKVAELVDKWDCGEVAIVIAYLHDVLEDTVTTGSDLIRLGIDPTIVRAVETLSRTPDQPYHAYIFALGQSAHHRNVIPVKIADLIVNYRTLEAGDTLTKRYQLALEMLVGIPFKDIEVKYREEFRTDQ